MDPFSVVSITSIAQMAGVLQASNAAKIALGVDPCHTFWFGAAVRAA